MSVTILAQNFTNYQGTAANGILRIYSNKNFEDTSNVMHSGGAVGSSQYFFSAVCSIINGIITVPQIAHPEPVQTDEGTLFTANVYTRNGQLLLGILANYRLPTTFVVDVTWEDVRLFNQRTNIPNNGDTYSRDQIDALVGRGLGSGTFNFDDGDSVMSGVYILNDGDALH